MSPAPPSHAHNKRFMPARMFCGPARPFFGHHGIGAAHLLSNPTGLGRKDLNSSLGGSWNQNDRVSGMDREANRAIERAVAEIKK